MNSAKRILLSFGATVFCFNAGLLLALHESLKYHGRVQLIMCAIGVLCVLITSGKIYSQWRRSSYGWSFSPFVIFCTRDFFGIVLFGFVFEWARTKLGREVHKYTASRGAAR